METAKIQVTVRRRFMDHVWLQLWWRWSTLPKAVLFCVVAVLCPSSSSQMAR